MSSRKEFKIQHDKATQKIQIAKKNELTPDIRAFTPE